jgi:hypothetical protein
MFIMNTTLNSFITPEDAITETGAGRNISFSAGPSCSSGMHSYKLFGFKYLIVAIGTLAGGTFTVRMHIAL